MLTRLIRRFVPACVLLCLAATASSAWAKDEEKKIGALVDYIGGDYKNAVRSGKVINQDEYKEMKEFSQRTLEVLDQLKAIEKEDKASIEPSLKKLAARIEQKEDEKAVVGLTQEIRNRLTTTYKIIPYPKTIPSFQAGSIVFTQNCAECHGPQGRGNGPSRQTMNPREPPPANFTDPETMTRLSPFKAFNTASFGVEGTAMPDFSALSEDERWQAAFFVFSLRFDAETAKEGKKLVTRSKIPPDLTSAATLSTATDEELNDRLRRYFPSKDDAFKVLAYLRRGILEENVGDPLIASRNSLREAMALYTKGENERAYQKSVDAYLDGFELAEPALFARDLSFGRSLEARFTSFRNAIKRGDDVAKVQNLYEQIDSGLGKASNLMQRKDELPGGYVFLNATLIILREGLEAALILAAILALLRVIGAHEALRYVHLGWVLALIAGLLTWVLAQTLLSISGSHRESMEGFATLTAAIVLFYMGYWLHTKAEARKWQNFVQDKVQRALSGKRILALVGLSFFAVYREAFEVVLFYQALWLQSSNAPHEVISGFVTGIAALSLAVLAILKLGLKVPLKYFFGATGALLYLLAFTFAGDGVKELQSAGWFSVTPLRYSPQVSILGVYPTLETLAAQAVMLMALLAASFWFAKQHQKAA